MKHTGGKFYLIKYIHTKQAIKLLAGDMNNIDYLKGGCTDVLEEERANLRIYVTRAKLWWLEFGSEHLHNGRSSGVFLVCSVVKERTTRTDTRVMGAQGPLMCIGSKGYTHRALHLVMFTFMWVILTCTTYLNIVADHIFPNGSGCNTSEFVQKPFEEFMVLSWPLNTSDQPCICGSIHGGFSSQLTV